MAAEDSGVRRTSGRRGWIIALALLALGVASVAFLLGPTTTRVGIDYRVRELQTPRYKKLVDFLHRHLELRTLADHVVKEGAAPEERVRAIFAWVDANIMPVPEGFPIIDDHTWDVAVRRYGTDDQAADLFCTLSVYAGVPAMVYLAEGTGEQDWIALAAVKLGGEWRLLDPARGNWFVGAGGAPLAVAEAQEDPGTILRQLSDPTLPSGRPWAEYLDDLHRPDDPSMLRGRLQMPLPRMLYELRRAIGLAEPVPWASRPP